MQFIYFTFAYYFLPDLNFLAHYYFDKTNNIYYNVGLVLPDLSRNFCKGHLNLKHAFEDEYFISLKNGCLKHLEADKIFHQSGFFKDVVLAISNILDKDAE